MALTAIHVPEDEWPVAWRRGCGCRVTSDDHDRTYAVVSDPEPGASRSTIGPFESELTALSVVLDRCPHA